MVKELLRIRQLYTDNKHEALLNDFRLQILEREIICLVGLNGSGKSTLAKVLSGEIPASKGTLIINGKKYYPQGQNFSNKQLEAEGVYVIQNETRLITNLKITENMTISSKGNFISLFKNPGKKEKLVEAILQEYAPELDRNAEWDKFSLSVHCKVGILKAFMQGARLIVLDRILEYCNQKERELLMQLVCRLREKGIAFLITFNKVAPFLESFDRLAVVRNGQLAGILHHEDYNPALLANLMTGQEFKEKKSIRGNYEIRGRNKLMEIQDLNVGKDLQELSFNLYSSEILGIYDPVQEKSIALLQVLSGSKIPDRGRILINGRVVDFSREHHAIRSGIGIVSERHFELLFFKKLNTGENLLLAAAKRSAAFLGYLPTRIVQYFQKFYPEEIGIPDQLINQPVQFLEKDLQFMLALNMRILSGAKIFLLENPVQSADLVTRGLVYRKIESLRKRGMGVIFISGDLTELMGFCDRILIFDEKNYTVLEGLNINEETVVKTIL